MKNNTTESSGFSFFKLIQFLLMVSIFAILVIDMNFNKPDLIGAEMKKDMENYRAMVDSVNTVNQKRIDASLDRQDSITSILIANQVAIDKAYKNISNEKQKLQEASDDVNFTFFYEYLRNYRSSDKK